MEGKKNNRLFNIEGAPLIATLISLSNICLFCPIGTPLACASPSFCKFYKPMKLICFFICVWGTNAYGNPWFKLWQSEHKSFPQTLQQFFVSQSIFNPSWSETRSCLFNDSVLKRRKAIKAITIHFSLSGMQLEAPIQGLNSTLSRGIQLFVSIRKEWDELNEDQRNWRGRY